MTVSLRDSSSRQVQPGGARGRPAAPVVLVVEHDSSIADAIATLIENSGYKAALTSDSTTALCQVRSGNVDLVLLDRELPGLSGLDLCRQVWAAARDAAVHLPVLMLTSVVRPEETYASVDSTVASQATSRTMRRVQDKRK
jgi:DNA-binding response OmpR family regulator